MWIRTTGGGPSSTVVPRMAGILRGRFVRHSSRISCALGHCRHATIEGIPEPGDSMRGGGTITAEMPRDACPPPETAHPDCPTRRFRKTRGVTLEHNRSQIYWGGRIQRMVLKQPWSSRIGTTSAIDLHRRLRCYLDI